jgi:hypothetical protein
MRVTGSFFIVGWDSVAPSFVRADRFPLVTLLIYSIYSNLYLTTKESDIYLFSQSALGVFSFSAYSKTEITVSVTACLSPSQRYRFTEHFMGL